MFNPILRAYSTVNGRMVILVVFCVVFIIAGVTIMVEVSKKDPQKEISQTGYSWIAGYTEDMREEGNDEFLSMLDDFMDDDMLNNAEYTQLITNKNNWDKRAPLREARK